MPWSRRQFLTAIGAGGAAAAGAASLASCSSAGSTAASSAPVSSGTQLTFTLWGADEEVAAFTSIAQAFTAKTGVSVHLDAQPYSQILSSVDARLQSGNAPDLFRVSYINIGQYTSQGVLADISAVLPSGFADQFTPALWKAVLDPDGKPVGVPHHTDCSALVYDKGAFAAAGVTAPTTLDSAWTWEQFSAAMLEVKGKAGGYPVAVNWQAAGAYRWLSFLAQAGGSVFGSDGKTVTIDSDAGTKALTYTKGLYTQGIQDPTFLVQAANYPDEAFPTARMKSIYTGDFNLPSLVSDVKDFEFGATYLPRDVRAATDLGGNAVVVPSGGKNVDAAAQFAAFLVSQQNMKAFCEATTVLPTRKDLPASSLQYSVRPDLMPVFVAQATTIPEDLVAASTSTVFTQVNTALQQQLEACFTGRQDVATTLGNLKGSIQQAVARGGS